MELKISDLIRKLEILKAKHGDNTLSFGVKDYYSSGRGLGEPMNLNLVVGDDPNFSSSLYSGVLSRDGHTTITFNLKSQDGKNPKITYRK